jgi:hypothetical protein
VLLYLYLLLFLATGVTKGFDPFLIQFYVFNVALSHFGLAFLFEYSLKGSLFYELNSS